MAVNSSKIHRAILLPAVLLILGAFPIHAHNGEETAPADSVTKKPNLITRIINYFDDANKEHPDRKFDFSLLGGPNYSEATSVQLALVAAGLYRTRIDSITPQSDVSIFGQGSVTGFYRVGIRGNHFAPDDKMRIIYNIDFAHFPLKFWGLGYDMASNKSNESAYTELQSMLWGEFMWKIVPNLYVGPSVNFYYSKAIKQERPELWNGQDNRIFTYGFGAAISYDTRDYPTNASKGVNITFKQRFFPGFMGNDYSFSSSELTAAWYKKFWPSGVMAFQLHGCSTYGNTPWNLLPFLDASNGVRSYYEGRYRDKNEADFVVELRQHIWRRNGIVVWAGAGTVFGKLSEVNINTLLPSYGIGYRWEFKKRVNVRVDFGLGKHSSQLTFGLHETF